MLSESADFELSAQLLYACMRPRKLPESRAVEFIVHVRGRVVLPQVQAPSHAGVWRQASCSAPYISCLGYKSHLLWLDVEQDFLLHAQSEVCPCIVSLIALILRSLGYFRQQHANFSQDSHEVHES